MNHAKFKLYFPLLLVALAWAFSANADEAAGIVIIASGEVQAVQADNRARVLKRRSKFYAGEVIKVAQNGKAQIRFADGTLLSLHPDTEVRVDAFHYDPGGDGAQDKNFFTLLKGGFRTITGAVGKKHPDAYRVNTPVATIGVRGTNYSVALDKQLYVGVWQGGVSVENDKGKLDLGMNAAFNFARIAGVEQSPKGLMTAPAILLDRSDILPPTQDVSNSASEKAAAQTGEEKPPAESGTKPRPAPPATTGRALADHPTAKAAFAGMPLPKTGIGETASSPSLPVSGAFSQAGVTDTSTTVGGDFFAQPASTDLNNDGVPDLLASTTTQRLSATELASLDRLGILIAGGNPSPYPATLARASDGSGGAPLFVWNGLLPTDPNFSTTAAIDVIRKGTASLALGSPQTHPTYPVSWGTWDGIATSPVLVQTDPNDATIATPLATQVFWMTTLPTPPTAIAALSGSGIYRNVISYAGGSSAGNISALFMSSIVDFGTGTVQGGMNVHSASDYWDMLYSGTLNNNLLNLTIDSANSFLVSAVNGTQAADGVLKAVFTGSNGEAITGVFDFQTTSGPLSDVDGVFLIDNTPVGDLRLSATEQAAIDRMGLAVVDNMSSIDPNAAGPLIANATDGASGSPILVDTTLNTFGYPAHIGRQGLSALTNLQANPSYTRPSDSVTVTLPVSWGTWNENLADAVLDQYDPEDPLLNKAIARPVTWMTVVPTAPATIAGLTGVIGYTNLLSLIGTSSGGSIVTPSATATVDFGTSAVSGNMNFNTNLGDNWSTNFSGTLTGPALNITTVGGTVNGATPVIGKVNGYLTGPKAEGMAGVFDYEASGNPATHAEGSFVLGCGTICP